jgi:hypothetical protein
VYTNPEHSERFDVHAAVKQMYKRRKVRSSVISAMSRLSIKDLFQILSGGIGLISPKSK